MWHYVLVIVVILAGTGARLAIGQTETQTYYACANARSGEMKIVEADTACPDNEYKIEWNNLGPEEPQGPAGVDGPQGPVGPATGQASFTLTVPTTPGSEYIVFERSMRYYCEQALDWDWPAPGPSQYIGVHGGSKRLLTFLRYTEISLPRLSTGQ